MTKYMSILLLSLFLGTSVYAAILETPAESAAFLAQFRKQCLDKHNFYRALHNTPPVQLNNYLNQFATEWAEYLIATGKFEHRSSNYGENLYATSGNLMSGDVPVTSWYNEIQYYNYNNPVFGMNTGHFTQVVWKNSKEIGVGIAKGNGRWGSIVVVNYNPPGNYAGQFRQNVLPLA